MIGIAVLALIAGYVAACLVAGFGTPPPLARFSPGGTAVTRRFADPLASVVAAYRDAVRATPGMRVVDARDDVLLVDSRPTPRVLDGNFGMVLRFRFARGEGEDGCSATADSMNKVPFAILVNHEAAFLHAERAVRMTAKRRGLREVVAGVG